MTKKTAMVFVASGILLLVKLPLAAFWCIKNSLANNMEPFFRDTVCEMQALSLEEKAVLGNVIGFDFPEDMTIKERRYTHSWDGSSLKVTAQYDTERLREIFADRGICPKYTTQPYDTYEIAETQVEIKLYGEKETVEFITYNDELNYKLLLQIGKNNG